VLYYNLSHQDQQKGVYFLKSKVLVGLSGGVDSCAAALILQEQGFEVIGAHLVLTPPEGENTGARDAARVAEALGIELRVIDLRDIFENTVIHYFTEEYLNGYTPNPCIICNREIKFGALLDIAKHSGIDYIATGHYAGIEKNENRWLLKKSAGEKDQSYFLYMLSQDQLSHALFPVNGMDKGSVRELALRHKMPVACKPDSQEICFIPGDDYAGFIRRKCQNLPPAGNFVDASGKVLGRHDGIINYTIGQRKGLGAFGAPVYVTNINPDNNSVTLGVEGAQYSPTLTAEKMNWIAVESINKEIRASVKIRFRAKPAPAAVIPDRDKVRIVFDKPQRAVTPGQSAVLYDGDIVLGGGRIMRQAGQNH